MSVGALRERHRRHNGALRMGYGPVIGAGSVVTRDVPPVTFAVATPARVVRTISDEEFTAHAAKSV